MKKILLIFCLATSLLLCACSPDYSATESDLLPDELSQAAPFDIFAQTFVTDASGGTNGGVISGMLGPFGSFEAQTPDRVLFFYQTDSMQTAYHLAYDKQDGTFSYACPDALCPHETCLFGSEYRIYAGDRHLFFQPLFGENGKAQYFYCTDLDGNGIKQIAVTTECELLCETDKGLYYQQTVLDGETYKNALWLYDLASEKSVRLTEEGELWYFYVQNDTVYRHDALALTLSVLSDDCTQETVLARDVTAVYPFDGNLYLHDTQKNEICKITNGTLTHAFDTDGIEFEIWCISGGDLYYTCHDRDFIESQAENKKLYSYLNQYNLSCGRIYRMEEGTSDAKAVYAGAHDGIPDLIYNFFADGDVLYIEYRDYKSFKNNYNTERHHAGIVIADADTSRYLDISGR